MNCKKCVYCVQSKRDENKVICKNKKLLMNLMGPSNEYELISEPCYCVFYKTEKQYMKEKLKNE